LPSVFIRRIGKRGKGAKEQEKTQPIRKKENEYNILTPPCHQLNILTQ
jgi:hypothetical protein